MRYLLTTITFLFFLSFAQETKAQSFAINNRVMDYGSIKEWKNDTTWFYISNTSSSPWFILPTFYNQEFQIIAPRGKIMPGQRIRVGLSYYTEDLGRFALEAPLYLSSETSPIVLNVKGKIQSFHPDALIYCPNLDPKDPKEVEDFLVQVIPEETPDERQLEEVVVEDDVIEEEELEEVMLDTVSYVLEEEVILIDTIESIVEVVDENPDTSREVVAFKKPIETKKLELGAEYATNNIVFLIDISGSMKKENKLENLKQSMKELVKVLRPQDKISIITYASRAKVIFKTTVFANKDSIISVIDALKADGSSYGKDGLNMAYALAEEEFIESGNNSVILATDGKFNYSGFSENRLYRQAASKALSKVKLSVIGFGNDMKALKFLKKLARFGNGDYVYIGPKDKNYIKLVEVIKEQSKVHKE